MMARTTVLWGVFILVVTFLLVRVESSTPLASRKALGLEGTGSSVVGVPTAAKLEVLALKIRSAFKNVNLNPFDEEEEEPILTDQLVPVLSSTACALYGSALVVWCGNYPGQIHLITMLRATGFDKIEKALKLMKRNIRDAIFSVVWNAPSFIQASRSIRKMQSEINMNRAIVHMAKKAKEDGVVTPQELAKIKAMRKRQIRGLQRDMKGMVRGAAGLGRVWRALDFDEILDVMKGFLFQMMAVLASGHNDSTIGKLISRWCLFLNLGSLFLDTNSKLGYPISQLLMNKSITIKGISEKKLEAIGNLSKFLMFSSAGVMVVFNRDQATKLNSAMISAAVTLRGVRSLINTFWDKKEDDSIWSLLGHKLETSVGGMLILGLTGVALYNRKQVGRRQVPHWMKAPLDAIETCIGKLALFVDKIV